MVNLSQIQTPFIQNQSISKLKPENQVEGFGQIFNKRLKKFKPHKTSDKMTNW
jgi:flagellar hook-basal body complex protein FliE